MRRRQPDKKLGSILSELDGETVQERLSSLRSSIDNGELERKVDGELIQQARSFLAEVRCACGRLLARINFATGHYELRRRGKPVAVVASGELHCVCGESVRVGGIEQAALPAASSLEDT